ncbi:MAG: hypothetical protein K8T25_07215 [Planctomycetia bacterium]|nr:hypothetical protein [Planctomycetia bacterium]
MRGCLLLVFPVLLGCGDNSTSSATSDKIPADSARKAASPATSTQIPIESVKETPPNPAPVAGAVLRCGKFNISNGMFIFEFKTGNTTHAAIVKLEVKNRGFVLTGGNLDPLTWIVDGEKASFQLKSNANELEGQGKVTNDNTVEGKMKQGTGNGASIGGSFTLKDAATFGSNPSE